MTPQQAVATIQRFATLAFGRLRIARVERDLGVSVHVAMKDDDLIVVFAEYLLADGANE